MTKAAVVAKAIADERSRILAILDKWRRADHLRLHAGEMTAQEARTVGAVLDAIKAEIGGSGGP